ncbi:MAG: hypothetical protein AVDCRST_MAG19-3705, partial [uncultured Thermomicrobiales bacterium]
GGRGAATGGGAARGHGTAEDPLRIRHAGDDRDRISVDGRPRGKGDSGCV